MFHWLRDSYGYDIHEVPEMLKLEGQQVNKLWCKKSFQEGNFYTS